MEPEVEAWRGHRLRPIPGCPSGDETDGHG